MSPDACVLQINEALADKKWLAVARLCRDLEDHLDQPTSTAPTESIDGPLSLNLKYSVNGDPRVFAAYCAIHRAQAAWCIRMKAERRKEKTRELT